MWKPPRHFMLTLSFRSPCRSVRYHDFDVTVNIVWNIYCHVWSSEWSFWKAWWLSFYQPTMLCLFFSLPLRRSHITKGKCKWRIMHDRWARSLYCYDVVTLLEDITSNNAGLKPCHVRHWRKQRIQTWLLKWMPLRMPTMTSNQIYMKTTMF